MKKSTKIWLAIAGVLLIALGVVCLCYPADTLFATAWLIGILTLVAGIAKLVFTFRTQAFLPNSGSRMLSGILEVLLGLIFICHTVFLAFSLPVIFAMWVIIESVIITVNSFDYKKVGYPGWWGILLLGLCGIVVGFLGLRNPDVSAVTLSTLIGFGVISAGVAHLLAVAGVNRFEKTIKDAVRGMAGVDEQ